MSNAVLWPREELPPRNFRIDPAYRNLRGPASVEGLTQIGASDAGLWVGTYTDIPVYQGHGGKRRIELWHAISGMLEGRLTPLIMPVFVSGRRPLPDGVTDADIDQEAPGPFDDGSLFDDGSGHENLWIDVTLATSASRRAVEISIDKAVCGDIAPGMRFSIFPGDWQDRPVRLYQVKRVVSQDAGSATIRIWPPLREALTEGQRFEWARPYAQMRLATDNEMDLMLLPGGLTEFPTVNFLEDL